MSVWSGCARSGNSLIVDPAGEVLAAAAVDETALRVTIDLGVITRERDQEPALSMRQEALYRADAVERLGAAAGGDR
ncbi:hypothetical protein [Streptomyces sp. NBC_00996]|uniref:hypothetical protein n=1 Tax=Streptomyces sp. NBC_00996 TaxID=2903710 RepID=UPI00386A3FF6|nr:hypothetical protein OG390_02810 [Streptomyces sp. NBC_00996]